MRRRRRQSTQLLKKRNLHPPTPHPFASGRKTSSKWKRNLGIFVLLVAVTAVTYYLYEKNFLNSSRSAVSEPEIPAAGDSVRTPQPFQTITQIEVLNGCGVNGVAKIFQSYLREHGFDVINTDNYVEDGKIKWDLEESLVIDQVGNESRADDVAEILGIPEARIVRQDNPAAIYDISVVVGKDYKKLLGME